MHNNNNPPMGAPYMGPPQFAPQQSQNFQIPPQPYQMTMEAQMAHARMLQMQMMEAQAQADITPQVHQSNYKMKGATGGNQKLIYKLPTMTQDGKPLSVEDQKIYALVGKILEEATTVFADVSKKKEEEKRNDDWPERCIRLVMKTLKKYNVFDDFCEVMMSGSSMSKCCPGRNDKQPNNFGRTNAMIMRLFRFPWLRLDSQVASTKYCRYPASTETKQVCFNPYHYKQVVIPRVPIPGVVVNKKGDFGTPPLRPDDPLKDHEHVESIMRRQYEKRGVWMVPNVTVKGDEIKTLYENFDPLDPLADFPMPEPSDIQSTLAFSVDMGTTGTGLTGSQFSLADSIYNGPIPTLNFPQPGKEMEETTYQSGLSSPASDMAFSPDVYIPAANPNSEALLFQSSQNPQNVEKEAQIPPQNKPEEPEDVPMEQEEAPIQKKKNPLEFPPASPEEQEFESIPAELTPIQSVHQGIMEEDKEVDDDKLDEELMQIDEEVRMDLDDVGPSPKRPKPTYPDGRPITPIEPKPLYRSSASELGELIRDNKDYECVEYEEDSRWLGLMYFEENTQVGDVKDFDRHHCLIDGYTSRCDSLTRFSIGFYSNPKRSGLSSEVRSLIGRGARLYLLAGEVYIENLCSIPMFVQSVSANMKNGFQLNTVSKLPPAATMKVFDMRLFSKQLAAAAEKTYNDVYALSRMCTIRISFVKGWGEHYRRSTVLRSPVWFQAHFHNPMRWIDSVLTCMGAPPRTCTSRT